MVHVKYLVIALALDLTLFFNLERISFGDEYYHFINIQGFVYAIGISGVVSVLLLPALRKWNGALAVIIWTGAYLAGKFWIFKSTAHPALGGFSSFITIAEVALIVLTILIASALAYALRDFEQAVENITLSAVGRRLKRLSDASEDIEIELVRSRRHHTPVSVVVVEPEPESIRVTLNRAVQQVQKAMMSRYVVTSMAAVLMRALRRTDLVMEQTDRGRFIILSPETNGANSNVLVKHIRASIADEMGVTVNCAVAEFPGDALTFEELVQAAENKLSERQSAAATAVFQYGKPDSD